MEVHNTREDLAIEEAIRAINAHTKRNPNRQNLIAATEECEFLLSRQGHPSAQLYLVLSQVHQALGDPLKSMRALAALSSVGDKSSRKESAIHAAALLRKHTSGQFADAGAIHPFNESEFISLIGSIAEACPSPYRRDRLKTFAALHFETPARALELAIQNAKFGESGILDLLTIIQEITDRPLDKKYLKQLATALEEAKKLSQTPRSRSRIDSLRFNMLSQPSLLSRLGVDPITPAELRQKLIADPDQTFHSLRNAKSIFENVYEGDEECKRMILHVMRRQLQNPAAHPRMVLEYLAHASRTIAFWNDIEQRTKIFDDVFMATASRRDEFAAMTNGCAQFLSLKTKEAYKNFNDALRQGNTFSGTGANSFFVDFDADIDVNALLQIEVTREGQKSRSHKALVNCSDARYFCIYGSAYIASLRDTGSEIRAHFHIAAPDNSAYALIEDISKKHGNVSFSFETPPIRMPAYYASMRFLRTPFFIRHIADAVFLTDIDVTFRTKPDVYLDDPRIAKVDLALRAYDTVRVVRTSKTPHQEIYRYPRIYPWSQISAGFVGVFGTEYGEKAAGLLSLHMAQHLTQAFKKQSKVWWIDQNSLLHTYRAVQADGGFKIGNIEEVGLPYDSFDYGEVRAYGGPSPIFSGLSDLKPHR